MIKPGMHNSRRSFIRKSITGLAGLTVYNNTAKSGESKHHREEGDFQYRTLGKTGIRIPIVSMGVMNAHNPQLVKAALDSGIVLLDTAHNYQQGRNEEMIGRAVKGLDRESFMVATKIPPEARDSLTGLYKSGTTKKAFIKRFETSIKRLGLDYLDVVSIHSVSRRESALFEPILEALDQLKRQGKTRFVGITTHKNEPEVIRAAIQSQFYDLIFTAYNFRQPNSGEIKGAVAEAAEKGIGIVAMKTQAGVYWDKERKKQINMKAALKWVLQDKNVHTAIPGFSTYDEMELDISVMRDLALSPEEEQDLKSGHKETYTGLYCAQCGRCLQQCHATLDIPKLMRSYMYAYGYRNLNMAKQTLHDVDLSRLNCAECKECTIDCTMGFNIRSRVLDITRLNDIPDDFIG